MEYIEEIQVLKEIVEYEGVVWDDQFHLAFITNLHNTYSTHYKRDISEAIYTISYEYEHDAGSACIILPHSEYPWMVIYYDDAIFCISSWVTSSVLIFAIFIVLAICLMR